MDSYTAANKNYFNRVGQSLDDHPESLELARRSARAMLAIYPFDEDKTTVMDFACGTGHLSRELAPYAQSILGVDISEGMVQQYNERVDNQGIEREEMEAVCVDLLSEEGTERLGGRAFDVIVCASSYHHFTSIISTTRTLVSFLNPGGMLLVVDLLESLEGEGSSNMPVDISHAHAHSHTESEIVPHKGGFTEAQMREAFEGSGLAEFNLETPMCLNANVRQKGRKVTLFLASGVKLA